MNNTSSKLAQATAAKGATTPPGFGQALLIYDWDGVEKEIEEEKNKKKQEHICLYSSCSGV